MVTRAAINISAARIKIKAAVCGNLLMLVHQGGRLDNRVLNIVGAGIDPCTHKHDE
jgi:hypothetical protein